MSHKCGLMTHLLTVAKCFSVIVMFYDDFVIVICILIKWPQGKICFYRKQNLKPNIFRLLHFDRISRNLLKVFQP